MREQVYAYLRPKEHFDRFHERSRTREPDWTYGADAGAYLAVRLHVPARTRNLLGEGARRRSGDPRAQPLLVHGPLPDGLLHPAQGPLHGQVAAVQTRADAVHLHPRRRLPGASGRARRRGLHYRGDVLARGGAITMYCEGGRSRTGKVAEQAKRGIGRLALGEPARRSSRLRFMAPPASATGSACSSRRQPFRMGSALRWERVPHPTPEQQQAVADEILLRDPGRCTPAWTSTAARACSSVSASGAAPRSARQSLLECLLAGSGSNLRRISG